MTHITGYGPLQLAQRPLWMVQNPNAKPNIYQSHIFIENWKTQVVFVFVWYTCAARGPRPIWSRTHGVAEEERGEGAGCQKSLCLMIECTLLAPTS